MASSWRRLFSLYLPLAFSDVIMFTAGPLVAATLTRLSHPEIHLAAFGVAESLAILLEAPIFMLLHASTTLSRSLEAFKRLFSFMLMWALPLTALMALLAWVNPLYDLVFLKILAVPLEVAEAGRPALKALLLYPGAIAWRRVMQGLLIRKGQSRPLAWAGLGRLLGLMAALGIGYVLKWPGALVGGMALGVSVVVEALWVTVSARAYFHPTAFADEREPYLPDGKPLPPTYGWLWSFYWPLAASASYLFLSKPLLQGGLARTHDGLAALAMWPAVWTTALLLANTTRMIQQLALVTVRDRESLKEVGSFAWALALLSGSLLALLAFTPAAPYYLGELLGLPKELVPGALLTLKVLSPLPFLVVAENWLQAHLVRKGLSHTVQVGSFANSAVSLVVIFSLARSFPGPGASLGALAVLAGFGVEILWLYGRSRQVVALFQERGA
ncbi:MAG: hypothetical protein QJR00_02570 [Bacillota bacterium]|nr:hypothetical protein [Bacillota bacterium]